MTCSDGVLRAGVKAIKTQPSVKLALVVHEVKTILLSNVMARARSCDGGGGGGCVCLTCDGRSHHHCQDANSFLTDETLFHLINSDT